MAEIRSQHDQRVHTLTDSGDLFYDQHGRAWHAEVEIKTQHPCSPLNPAGWSAPLDPPRNYFKYVRGLRVKDAKGKVVRQAYDVEIQYDQWIADWRDAGRRWEEDATKQAIKLHGATWKDRKVLPEDVRLMVGDRPGGKLKAVEAAKQGQPYVLGLRPFDPSNKIDVELRDLLEPSTTYTERNWLAGEKELAGASSATK